MFKFLDHIGYHEMMALNCEKGLGCGLGDLCMALLFNDVKYYVRDQDKIDLVHIFGRTCTEVSTDAKLMRKPFCADLGRMRRADRLGTWMNALRIDSWSLPQINLPVETIRWAVPYTDAILLFPKSNGYIREWSTDKWIELYHLLKARGEDVVVCMPKEDKAYKGLECITDLHMYFLVSLAFQSKLIISNDSFPAHLSVLLEKDCICLMGPTCKGLYGHSDKIRCLHSTMKCSGCGFKISHQSGMGYREECLKTCASLGVLSVKAVLNEVDKIAKTNAL